MDSRRGFLLLLLLSASTLLAGPERAVGPIVQGPAPGQRSAPSVATDGRDFFLVWRDDRTQVASVMGTRVTADGAIVDPNGLLIAHGTAPQVLWTGTDWAVFYGSTRAIAMTRVSRDGVVSAPRVLAGDGVVGGAATNGEVTIVTYSARAQQRAVVVDREGEVVRDVLLGATNDGRPAAIASNGRTFLAVWRAATLEAMRFDASGQPLDAAPRSLGEGFNPRVGADGDRYLVVANRTRAELDYVLAARAVTEDFETSEWRELPSGSVSANAVLWTGARFLVFGQRLNAPFDELFAAGVDADAATQSFDVVARAIADDSASQPAAASNGSRVLVAWIDESEVVAGFVSPRAVTRVIEPLLLSKSANVHYAAAIASAGDEHLAVWLENNRVFAAPLAADGTPRNEKTIRVSNGIGVMNPVAAFDGTQYVVAWYEANDGFHAFVVVRFVSRDGVLAPESIRIETPFALTVFGARPVSLAPDDRGTLVVWSDSGVMAVHIPRGGASYEGAPVQVSSRPGAEVVAAWNGREYLVVTTDGAPVGEPWIRLRRSVRVLGTRVSAALTPLDPEPFVIGDHALRLADGAPDVASDGRDWLVVWHDYQPDRWSIDARRVFADGTMSGDANGTRLAAGILPSVVWNGSSYTIAWKEADQPWRASFATIARSGRLALSASRLFTTTEVYDSRIALAATNGSAIAAYLRPAPGPQFGHVLRTFVRLLDDVPTPRARAVRH
ncbi:MAG TPA: hypothetical protein VF824_14505 [Thermoanaerobaculia bacterium]